MDRPMRPFDGKLLTGWYGYREFSDGPLANLGCHFIDLYNYIVGTTLPVSCVAQGGTFTWKDEYGFTCPDHCPGHLDLSRRLPGQLLDQLRQRQRQRAEDLRRPGHDRPDATGRPRPTPARARSSPASCPARTTPVAAVETPDHFLDWLQCLRSRKPCNAPIEAGYNHCVPALMAVRALDTGRRQIYDAQTREIREG